MDEVTKSKMKAEISAIKGQMFATDGFISMVATAASMPIMVGPMLPPIMIQAFNHVAKALEQQQKNIVKLTSFVEDLLDQS